MLLIKTYILSCTFLIITGFTLANSTYLIKGKVVESDSNTPIPGATIRILNTNKGTYSSTTGRFNLPVPEGKQTLRVSSIGHKSREIEVSQALDSMIIELEAIPVIKKEVQVVAEIDANQIVSRAIERKKENLAKIKTFQGLLYTKMVIEFGGDVFEKDINSSGSSVSIDIGPKKAAKEYQMLLTETFSNVYNDYESDIRHTEIVQRRQTANIKPNQNLIALGTFINFYDNTVNLINAEVVTPLSDDALDYYNFKLIEKSLMDDRFIYILKLEPKTTTYPTFKGKIKIVEGTYNLIEAELEPARNDIIPLLDSLNIVQKFTEVEKNIWYPDLLEFDAKARVEVIAGIMSILADVKVSNIFSEILINNQLPDSIYTKNIPRISVVADADSSKPTFWENNSLREISAKEKEIYNTVDSLVTIRDSLNIEKSDFKFDFINPILEFDRVNSITIGLSPSIRFKDLLLNSKVKYSFGQKILYGSLTLLVPILTTPPITLNAYGSIYSIPETFGFTESDYTFINTLNSGLFHRDIHDYFRIDGWYAGCSSYIYGISLFIAYFNSNSFSLDRTTNRSIFSNNIWRDNPEIIEGNYSTFFINADYNLYNLLNLNGMDFKLGTKFLFGENAELKKKYKSFYSNLEINVPTFRTGYEPMELSFLLHYGKGSDNLPLQFQFRAPSNLQFMQGFGSFYSIPVGYYGGTEYLAGNIRYNLRDLWWRALGLPLYEGRGIDFIISASAFRSTSSTPTYYLNTNKDIYSEIGFGLSKIPIFISNIFYLTADFRFGIGNLAKDRFGWGIGANLPF